MAGKNMRLAAVGALLCGMAGPALAETQADSNAELRAELAAMKAEIAQMKQSEGDNWLNERRAEEVKGLIREVLTDAQTRATLAEDGFYAGNKDGKFFLSSTDGNYTMKIAGQIDLRYIVNWEGDQGDSGSSDSEDHGFQLRRVKLKFGGNVINKNLKYAVNLAMDRDDGNVFLEDALFEYDFPEVKGLSIVGGKFKIPFLRQELISSSRLLAVERANVTEFFTQNRSIGLMGAYEQEMFKVQVGIFQGANTEVSDFNAPGNAKFNVTGRADVKILGDWKQAKDVAAWSGKDPALFVGGALSYQSDRNTAGGTSEDYFGYTIDALAKFGPASVMGAFMGAHLDSASRDPLGLLVEVGVFVIPDKLQPYGTIQWLDPDSATISDDLVILTLGANYFFKKHNAKLTTDVSWVASGDGSYSSGSGNRISPYGSSPFSSGTGFNGFTGENQVVLRTQFQLLF